MQPTDAHDGSNMDTGALRSLFSPGWHQLVPVTNIRLLPGYPVAAWHHMVQMCAYPSGVLLHPTAVAQANVHPDAAAADAEAGPAQISMHSVAVEGMTREEIVMGPHAVPAAHTTTADGSEKQTGPGIPTATTAAVGVQRRYNTRAKAARDVMASGDVEDTSPHKMPRTTSVHTASRAVSSPLCDFQSMDAENRRILAQDKHSTWNNGVRRIQTASQGAADLLSWVVENTSRTLSTIRTDSLCLDGFHNWDAVHSGELDAARQLQHTFVISRSQRRRALNTIPGLSSIVATVQTKIESMHLHDTPQGLEWLTGHILNQGDVNACFDYHQDTTEERHATSGRRDRCVRYTAIIKLNRGGCTSMKVCGQSEVFYLAPGGSGVVFRSDLYHRTEKAEPGIWKIALFFGTFL